MPVLDINFAPSHVTKKKLQGKRAAILSQDGPPIGNSG
jgi:hypothetical protein